VDNNAKPAVIRAKLKFPDVETFIERYAPNVSRAGIFVKTADPRPAGTPVRFEFQISDGTPVMRGLGEVAWIREADEGDRPAGMGIRFLRLDARSQENLDRVVAWKQQRKIVSRYSEMPPPPLPGELDEAEADAFGQPAPVSAPEPAPVQPPAPQRDASSPPPAPKRRPAGKARKSTTDIDLSAIDSMLADLSSDVGGRARRKKHAPSVEPEPAPRIAVPEPVAEPEPVIEPEPEPEPELEPEAADEPVPVPVPAVPISRPPLSIEPLPPLAAGAFAEPEAPEGPDSLEFDEDIVTRPEPLDDLLSQLGDGYAAPASPEPAPVVARGSYPPSPADIEGELEDVEAEGELEEQARYESYLPPPPAPDFGLPDLTSRPIADDADSGSLVDLLEPEERVPALAEQDEPGGLFDGRQPEPAMISFMPRSSEDSQVRLASELESVLATAEEDDGALLSTGEIESLTIGDSYAGLGREPLEDSLPAGTALDDDDVLTTEIEEQTLSLDQSDSVADLIDEIARDSAPPAKLPPAEPLLSRDHVAEALDDFFKKNAPSRQRQQPPDTLPDDAVPPGLVRQRTSSAGPPPPPVPDGDGKKKGFFRKLFGS
jgi:uncharacterized protein (TIGR02266 family)